MRIFKLYCLTFSFFVLFIAACKKNTSKVPQSPHLYIAGIINDSATIWIDSIQLRLPEKFGQNSYATSIFVSDTNIFVAGWESDYVAGSDINVPVLWKNGIDSKLGTNGAASSVFVSGNDVYVCGNDNGYACYWKNGVEIVLNSLPGTLYGTANSITVSGTDIFIAGDLNDNSGRTAYATFWKNGTPIFLDSDTTYSTANCIYLSGKDIYICGLVENNGYRAIYWENGIPDILTTSSSIASSIVVSNNDVYVCGEELIGDAYSSTYWKNGVATDFAPGLLGSGANSIILNGSDIYIGGVDWDKSQQFYTATYWKNEVPVAVGPTIYEGTFTNENLSVVSSIFFK
jgi:hypothetical protein